MEKIKDLVKKKSNRSLHRKSRSMGQSSDSSRRSDDIGAVHTLDAMNPASNKDLPPVPAVNSGNSTPLRPSSQWGTKTLDQSPTYSTNTNQTSDNSHAYPGAVTSPSTETSKPLPASIHKRSSSLQHNRKSLPPVEADYDEYRNMLRSSAVDGPPGEEDVFHDASQDHRPLPSTSHQHEASRDYGRRQIHGTEGADLGLGKLSLSDNQNASNSTTRAAAYPSSNYPNGTTARKALPIAKDNVRTNANRDGPLGAGEHGHKHSGAEPGLADHIQAQPSALSLSIAQRNVNDPNYTPRLPPGFVPGNSVDTNVHTTVRPAVTHETLHTKRIEISEPVIDRHIHVDHYYHFVQPIKVVEVMPARHYRIHSKTGEKLSIAAPAGWQLPADLTERRAPNFAQDSVQGLHWGRRDYIVDDENPAGRMLSEAEVEQERADGHLVSPVGVTSVNGGSGSSHDAARGKAL